MSQYQEEQIAAIERLQDYIETHLKESMTLLELSRVAGYSPNYTAQLFKKIVGHNLFEYIRKLKLTHAATDLRDKKEKTLILDVALDYVFDSHEGFTRAFTKAFGLTPKTYQQKPAPIPLFLPSSVRTLYEQQKKGALPMSQQKPVPIFTQVINKPARKLLLKRGIAATHYFEYCEEVGCDVWGTLTSVKDALAEPMGLWLPEKLMHPNTSHYVQGVEVPTDYSGTIPEGFDLIDLEPCQIMIFQGPTYDDSDFSSAIDAVWQAIDQYDPTLYGFEWAKDEAPRFQLEPQGYRGYIEGRPVKKI